MNSQLMKLPIGAILLSFSIAACTTMSQPPNALLSDGESEIKMAQSVGARDAAPVSQRSATENLKSAKKAIENHEFEEARILLEKSLADAEYAAAKARSEQAQSASNQVNENLEALKKAL